MLRVGETPTRNAGRYTDPVMNVMGVADGGRDRLMRAALAPPDRALEAWRHWQHAGGHPQTDLIAQRWLPLIGWNLRQTALDVANRTLFREASRGVWASNVRIMEAARPALDALNAHGVRTLLLKGAARP
jgi:hypothetical protein